MRRECLAAAATITLIAAASAAGAVVEILEATGNVSIEEYGTYSPVPGWCYWSYPTTVEGTYHAGVDDGSGPYCVFPWLAHCDGDSLLFQGAWDEVPYNPHLDSTNYSVVLSCDVLLTATTQLAASREVSAGLDDEEHSLSLTLPDESQLIVLAAEEGPDQVELDLEPGIYGVRLRVLARDRGPYRPAYSGAVVLRWSSDGTPVEASSWGAVKAMYE